MMFSSRLLSVVLLTAGVHGLALGQATTSQQPISQLPPSARKLIAIKVTGSKRYTEAEIAAESGLQMGAPAGDDEFKKASRHLGDTGAFTEIAYTFSYSSAGTKLEFHVKDVPGFVPVHFEDFVWFPESEVRRRIKEHVPLFNGEVPIFGRMAEEVSDVLQAMLVENAIPGHVDFVRYGKQDGPIESIIYKVSEVLVRVRNIEFTGAGPEELPALEAAAKKLSENGYSRARLDDLVEHQLLPVYHARGYLQAAFSPPEPKLVKDAGAQAEDGPRNQSIVDVVFAVTPGVQYILKGIDWSGNKEFPSDVLQKQISAKIGKPADTVRLNNDLKQVKTLYGSKGYLAMTIKANAEFEPKASTVALHLVVKEDAVYHMGDLEFRGLDNSLTAKLYAAWSIRLGDVYDATYLEEYLREAHKLLPAGFDWDVTPHVTANVRDKSVDIDLIYSVKAAK